MVSGIPGSKTHHCPKNGQNCRPKAKPPCKVKYCLEHQGYCERDDQIYALYQGCGPCNNRQVMEDKRKREAEAEEKAAKKKAD